MGSIQQLVTAGQLLEESGWGRCELIRGEIVPMTPTSGPHGRISSNVDFWLKGHVRAKGLGAVYAGDTGFLISRGPDTVRCPDVAFVRANRMEAETETGFFQVPPDLAIEVLSPNDRASEVLAKVHDWLTAGSEVVWVVDPQKQTVEVFRRGAQPEVLTVKDRLTGGEVLPGFEVSVADIFAK